jgi:succinoglycan biosynthesis transport protein ExoP
VNIVKEKMLQRISPTEIYGDQRSTAPQYSSQGIPFESIVDFVRRRALVILYSALIMTTLGVFYFFLVPAPYTAVASLEIDTRRFQLFQHAENFGEKLIDSAAAVESQLEILKSENIALKVVKKLNLADDPEFGQGNSIPIIGSLLGLRSDTEFARTQNAIKVIENSLKVQRLGMAYIIEINFQSIHSERAAQIANAIAEAYIADQLDSKYEATRQGSKWLEGRLGELRDQLANAQKAIIGYKAENNLLEDTKGRPITEQQLSNLNSQLTATRAKKTEVRTQLDRISKILSNDSSDATTINVAVDIVSNNLLITKLRAQYIENASRESEWSEKYGRDNLTVVNLRNSMRAIGRAVRDELKRTEESLKNDYEAASESEKSLEEQLQKAVVQSQGSDKAQVTLRQLESSAQEYGKLYDNFLSRHTEAVEQQSFAYTEARLITRASPPMRRSYRKTVLIIALFPFAGLFFGVGIGALREFMDRGLRTSSQVETMLGLDCLSLIPLRENDNTNKSWIKYLSAGLDSSPRPTASAGLASSPRPTAHERFGTVNVIDQPFSQFAEAIRSVKLAIDMNGRITEPKVIGLTSSLPNEGKTTISMELAKGIAQAGARVIIVDCDFRNPSLSRAIAPSSTCGILEVLTNKVSLEETMWKHPSTKLALLPASIKLRVANSSEILASAAMKKLFDELRQKYNYIIVDLPPLAPLVDVRPTGHFIDNYVFVIEWGGTSGAIAQHALSTVAHIREKFVGAVLNKVDMKQMSLYDGNRAAFYNNKYYGQYDYTS